MGGDEPRIEIEGAAGRGADRRLDPLARHIDALGTRRRGAPSHVSEAMSKARNAFG